MSRLFYFLLPFLLISCLEAPVQYKEVTYPVSRQNLRTYCTVLESGLTEYSCRKNFNQPFEWMEGEEIIKIDLTRDKLIISYRNKAEKNEALFELYTDMISQLEESKTD